jgi:predicted secreted Zn-dependent protease
VSCSVAFKRIYCRILVVLCLLSVFSCQTSNQYKGSSHSPSFGEVLHQEKYELVERERFYFVRFTSVENMARELDKAAPLEKFHAYTHNNLYWTYEHAQREGFCEVEDYQVRLTITYTLPKVSDDTTDSEVLEIWSDYYAKLLAHEHNHGEYGKIAAGRMVAVLENARDGSCKKLKISVKKEMNKVRKWHKQQHEIYDAETDHGFTEGVFLPLYPSNK